MSLPKQVVLVQNYFGDEQQSMLRFGNLLAESLQAEGVTVSSWRPRKVLGGKRYFGVRLAKWMGYVDKFVLGMCSLAILRLRNGGAMWHIVDHSNAGYACVLPRARLSVTCHDCIAIDEASSGRTGERVGLFGPIFQRWILWGIARANRVVAVSEATARDLKRIGVDSERVCVIHNGMVVPYARAPKDRATRMLTSAGVPTDRPFVFMVGSNLKRKNRVGAVRIFEKLREMAPDERRLILAGKDWSPEVREAVAKSVYAEDIVEAGTLSDEALEAAYSLAEVVIFPSLAEGFGLPVIEGQACGAIVVASNIEPLPEVGGDGALYADPLDHDAYALAIVESLAIPGLREAALRNAGRFNPSDMARKYVALAIGAR